MLEKKKNFPNSEKSLILHKVLFLVPQQEQLTTVGEIS